MLYIGIGYGSYHLYGLIYHWLLLYYLLCGYMEKEDRNRVIILGIIVILLLFILGLLS